MVDAASPFRADVAKIAIGSQRPLLAGYWYSFQLAIISPPSGRHWWRLPVRKDAKRDTPAAFIIDRSGSTMGFDRFFASTMFLNRTRRMFSTLFQSTERSGALDTEAILSPTLREIMACKIGSKVQLNGWVRSIRRHKNVSFIKIYDGSSTKDTQLVLSLQQSEQVEVGSSILVHGVLSSSMGDEQQKEVQVSDLQVLGSCPGDEYPIQKKSHTADYLRSIPHLRPRTFNFGSILRLKSQLGKSLEDYLHDQKFCKIHAPVITFSDCEAAGETFRIEDGSAFFGKDACLTVSAQLHAELAATALGRVYTFGPIFRAEKHNTSRHLAEFMMLEAEICFVESVEKLMDFAESMIQTSVKAIPSENWEPFDSAELVERRDSLNKPFTRLSYTEAIDILKQSSSSQRVCFTNVVEWGRPLQKEHEMFLAEHVVRGPVFVYNYPAPIKAFYMKTNGTGIVDEKNWEKLTVGCFDLLLPKVAEIVGGSLREDRLENLTFAMHQFGLREEDYRWYTDLRRYGTVPHGGFGLGFDRLLQFLTDTSNIRDVTLVPRSAGNSSC